MDPIRKKRREELIEELQKAVPEMISQFPTISKIWIVGSVAKPIFFDMRSDIDIVVDGLPKENYFDLYRLIESKMSCPLDLIMLSDIQNKDRAVLETKVVVYEKAVV